MTLICKEDLIKQIEIDSHGYEGQYGDEWHFMDTIEKAPEVDPPTRVIAKLYVDEELLAKHIKEEYELVDGWTHILLDQPKDDQKVFVTVLDEKSGEKFTTVARFDAENYPGDYSWWDELHDYALDGGEVIAWMPLPGPYREEKNDV